MEYTEADGERLVAEFMARAAAKPVKGRYPVATEHSTTQGGGKVLASSGLHAAGGRVALAGDVVRYPDGSETRIAPDTGATIRYEDRAIALVDSALDNGDTITGPQHDSMVLVQYADGPPVLGSLAPASGAAVPGGAS